VREPLELGDAWRACFQGAWDAFRAGTIPVGAAVASADGAIVARGRNRIFDPPGHGLSGSRLAHAEVDALAQLPTSARYPDHVLYSTLEPCLLCVAATLHATVGRIEYAAADPFGGGCIGTIDTAHWRRNAPEIAELREDWWAGQLSAALQSAFWQAHSDSAVAPQIIDAFGEDARVAGGRVIERKDALPAEFEDALPHLVNCLNAPLA
jgi:tRNA(Arg) A34 adenosine deaminase TadA